MIFSYIFVLKFKPSYSAIHFLPRFTCLVEINMTFKYSVLQTNRLKLINNLSKYLTENVTLFKNYQTISNIVIRLLLS